MKIFPVVHIKDPDTARGQGALCLSHGADGVYLIDHSGRVDTIWETLRKLRADCPGSFVGVNLLGHSTDKVYELIGDTFEGEGAALLPDAVWADNVENNLEDPTAFLQRKNREERLKNILLLGGISFKYTMTFSEDPAAAAAEVARLRDAVDVVTTSGAGTGTAPTVEKLRAVKEAAGDKPVAVASGISAGNIRGYAGFVDQILVATSIETSPYSGIFDEQKLKELIKKAHGVI